MGSDRRTERSLRHDPEVSHLDGELSGHIADLLRRQPGTDGLEHGRRDLLCMLDRYLEVLAHGEEELVAAELLRRLASVDHTTLEERLDRVGQRVEDLDRFPS